MNTDLYVCSENTVDCITTRSSCVYMGKELINMYYNVFLELFGLLSTNTMHLYSEGPKKMGVIMMYTTLTKIGRASCRERV